MNRWERCHQTLVAPGHTEVLPTWAVTGTVGYASGAIPSQSDSIHNRSIYAVVKGHWARSAACCALANGKLYILASQSWASCVARDCTREVQYAWIDHVFVWIVYRARSTASNKQPVQYQKRRHAVCYTIYILLIYYGQVA